MKFSYGSLMVLHVGEWNSAEIDTAANKIGISHPNLYIHSGLDSPSIH